MKGTGAGILAIMMMMLLRAPAPAGAMPADITGFIGVMYYFQGREEPIAEPPVAVDALASSIVSSTEKTLQAITARRASLRYGRSEADAVLAQAEPQLSVYPAPAGMAPSRHYTVTIRHSQLSATQESFVYQTDARKTDTNRSLDTSWTSFSFAGTVEVAVRKLTGPTAGCVVRPAGLQARVRFADNVCYITLAAAANFSVEFLPNTQNPILHPMLVFANPPEVDVPAPSDPGVRYFGPGIHKIGPNAPIRSNETVYLAGGAWVEGTFTGQGLRNVVIKGRGVISGRSLDTGNQEQNKNQPGLINILNSENIVVEGLTFVDAPRFNVRVLGKYVTLRNLKVMSWWYSTDGLVAGNSGLVEDNFLKVNDDAIKLHWGDNIVRRNVIWQLENGAPFNISWNIHQDVADFHVYDNDVIHADHYFLFPQAIFRARHAGGGHMQRYLFENIRVEDADWRLFYIILENNQWYDPQHGYGSISHVIFRNISSLKPFRQANVVKGIDTAHMVSNIAFVDIAVAGHCLYSAASGRFEIDPASTDRIAIGKSDACGR